MMIMLPTDVAADPALVSDANETGASRSSNGVRGRSNTESCSISHER